MALPVDPVQRVNPFARLFGGMFGQQPAAVAPTGMMSPPAQPPGFLQNNSGMLMGLGMGLLAHRQNALANPLNEVFQQGMLGGVSDTQRREAREREQAATLTEKWLIDVKGLTPEEAAAARANPAILASYLKTGDDDRTANIQEYEYAKAGGYAGTFQEWLAAGGGAGGPEKFGVTPGWGLDAEGKVVPIQFGEHGSAITPELPEGVTMTGRLMKINGGTEWIMYDPVTQTVVERIPKDIEGEAAAEEAGKARGKAEVNLPGAVAASKRLIEDLDAALNDPALASITGGAQGRLPGWAHTEEMARAQSRIEQIQGETFLQAYNDLRGAAAITEQESKFATAALNRLKYQNVGDADYRKAMEEFKAEVHAMIDLAYKKAGQQPPPRDYGGKAPAEDLSID